jgi:hypothetical protein
MDAYITLFSIEELDALDEKQLEMLRQLVRNEILNEIRTNSDFRNNLRGKLEPIKNQFRPQGRPQRARGSRSPRTPEPSSSE